MHSALFGDFSYPAFLLLVGVAVVGLLFLAGGIGMAENRHLPYPDPDQRLGDRKMGCILALVGVVVLLLSAAGFYWSGFSWEEMLSNLLNG